MLLFKVFVVVIWNYKDPNSAISKMHGKSITFSVDPIFFIFFSCDCGAKNHSKGPQRNGINHGTHIIYRTVLSAGLWLFTSIWSRNNRFSLSLLYGKSHATGQCQCHWRIPVNVLGHINKIVEQYNKFNGVSRVPVPVTKKKMIIVTCNYRHGKI